MLRRTGDKQIHQDGSHTSQYGQDALQIEETQNKAKCPHANHVRHPEVADQFTCVVQAHAQTFGVFRHPRDKAQLTEDVAQRGDRQEQHANAPFFFYHWRVRLLRVFTQRREFAAEGQQENGDVYQADAGINPIPFDAAR